MTHRCRTIDIVYDTPIVGHRRRPLRRDDPHSDAHDRTLGINTVAMTTDHLDVRGFANGEVMLYLSFEPSDALTATIERSTFVPALADVGFPNGGGRTYSANVSFFTFVNARVGLVA